jgi:HK97 family phage prohead protease
MREESPDRMGDVITASGWQLDNFKKNPVFMLSHDHSGLPIGTVPTIGVEAKQLISTVQFDKGDPEAMAVKGKYERGVMRAVSVGFRALDFEERAETGKQRGILFKSAELLEISAVAVPAHPAALIRRAMREQRFYSLPTPTVFGITNAKGTVFNHPLTCSCPVCTYQRGSDTKPAPEAFSAVEVEQARQAIRSIAK